MMIDSISLDTSLIAISASTKAANHSEITDKTHSVALRRIGYLLVASSVAAMALHIAQIVVWTGTPLFSLLFFGAGCVVIFRNQERLEKKEEAAPPKPAAPVDLGKEREIESADLDQTVSKLDHRTILLFLINCNLDKIGGYDGGARKVAAIRKLKGYIKAEIVTGEENLKRLALQYFDAYVEERMKQILGFADIADPIQQIRQLERHEELLLKAPRMDQLQNFIRLRFQIKKDLVEALAQDKDLRIATGQAFFGRCRALCTEARIRLVKTLQWQFDQWKFDEVILKRFIPHIEVFKKEFGV